MQPCLTTQTIHDIKASTATLRNDIQRPQRRQTNTETSLHRSIGSQVMTKMTRLRLQVTQADLVLLEQRGIIHHMVV